MAFLPPVQTVDPLTVGKLYHVAIGTTTTGLSSPDRIYGYMLVAKSQLPVIAVGSGNMGHFEESTDISVRDRLTQSFSPNLVDRDFVDYPRVSQGDFAGGGLQTVFIDPHRFWDSDLDISQPGYLRLNALWSTDTYASLTAPNQGHVCELKGGWYFTFGDASKNIYKKTTGAAATSFTAAIVPKYMTTDGSSVYYSDGTSIYQYDGTNEYQVASAVNGTAISLYVTFNGTGGRFLWYSGVASALYKVDLTLPYPIAAGLQAIVPTNFNAGVAVAANVTDLVQYQIGHAFLTTDFDNASSTVWYYDGQNTSPIVRIRGYIARGMCNCLGNLFVALQPRNGATPIMLAKVGKGDFQIVAKFGSPLPASSQGTAGPVAAGENVYVPLFIPNWQQVSGPNFYGTYNALTGAVGHLPNATVSDFNSSNPQPQSGDNLGLSMAWAGVSGTTGTFGYQNNTFIGGIKYQSTGWLVSSRIDANTPSISKLMRRVTVNHAPLAAGEQILVQGWVDKQPTDFTTTATKGSAYNQYDSQVINSTVGSSITVLTFPSGTVGHSMFYAVQLTAGTSNLTSPTVINVSLEVGVPWLWRFIVNCSSRPLLLGGGEDSQGLTGFQRYGLLHDAWESSNSLTFYHPNGVTYTCVIDSLRFLTENPTMRDTGFQTQDYEAVCEVTLRQSAV